MSTLVRVPGSILDTGNRGLGDSEAGGNLSLGACRPLHLVGYRSHMRSSMLMLVLSVTDLLKMIGVHARRLMAHVVKIDATGERPMRTLINHSVGLEFADHSITAVEGASPQPAVRSKSGIRKFVSRLVLSRVVTGDVVERFPFDMTRTPPIYGREGCPLATTAFTQACWVINTTSHGPASITALTAGGDSH